MLSVSVREQPVGPLPVGPPHIPPIPPPPPIPHTPPIPPPCLIHEGQQPPPAAGYLFFLDDHPLEGARPRGRWRMIRFRGAGKAALAGGPRRHARRRLLYAGPRNAPFPPEVRM